MEADNKHSDYPNDEIDLKQLVLAAWATRVKVILSCLVFAALFFGYLFFKVANNTPTSYYQLIGFTFKNIEEGRYPNGDTFRLEDIIAPSVLNAVYDELDIQNTGLSLNDFSSQLHIYPYTPERDFIVQKYSAVLNDKNADDVTKAEARLNLNSELNSALKRSARIIFDNEKSALPDELALETVSQIAKTWAQQAIFVRGVTKSDLAIIAPEVISSGIGAKNSTLTQLSSLWSHFNTLKRQIVNLQSQPSAATVVDESSRLSVQDLDVLMNNLEVQFVKAPAMWSHEQTNALSLNKALYSPRLFDISLVEDLDYLIAVDVLGQRIELVSQNVKKLSGEQFGGIVTDPMTGLALNDIERLLTDMEQYSLQQMRAPLLQLGISKDPSRVPLYYNFRISQLQREADSLKQQVAAVQNAEKRYVNGGAGSIGGQAQGGQSNSALGQTTTLIPQLGDAFLDKIISMSEKGGDVAYRQDLNKDTIALERRAIELEKQISEIRQYISLFEKAPNDAQSKKLRNDYLEKIDQIFPTTFDRLKTYAEVTQRISNRLRFAQEITKTFSGSPYAISGDYYLQNVSDSSVSMVDIKAELMRYAEIARNLRDKLNMERYGVVNDLYRYLDEPRQEKVQLISKRDIIAFIAGLILVGLFSMLITMMVRAMKAKS